jgi:hypothetical protein
MKASISRAIYYLLAFTGLCWLGWLRAIQPPNTVDDAYITFRYARNIVTGVGFVYNAGEHVLGTTTPAYTLLLAGAALLGGFSDFPRLAIAVNAACDALTFCLLLRLASRLTGRPWVGLITALLFALDARLLDFSTGGMESSFNLLSIVATLTLFFHGRTRWAALTAGLAVLVRPDGAMLAVALFAALGLPVLRTPRRWPWIEVGLFLGLVLPWVIFAFAYFGQPIPQSVLAKSVVYRLENGLAFRAFLVQLRTVFPFSLPPLNDPEPLWRQLLQAIFPISLCVLGLVAANQRHRQAWMMGLYIALFITFFSAGNPLWLGWYEIPMLPLYQLLVLCAAVWLGRRIVSDGSHVTRDGIALASGSVLAIIMAIPQLSRLNALPWEIAQRPRFIVNSSFNKERESDYVTLAQMLTPAAHNGRRVAIPEIGAFGYAYPASIFDTTGLVTPAIHKYFPIPAEIPVGLYTVPRRMILEERPDIFIAFDSFIAEDLLRTPESEAEFLAQYVPTIGLVSRATFPLQRLVAYRRRDLPVEAELPADLLPAQVQFDDGRLQLEGYFIRFGQTPDYHYLEVTLVWRNGMESAQAKTDRLAQVDLFGANGTALFQILNYPGEGLYRTSTWETGEIVIDRYQLKLSPEGPGPYTVQIRLLDDSSGATIEARPTGSAKVVDNTVVIPNLQP